MLGWGILLLLLALITALLGFGGEVGMSSTLTQIACGVLFAAAMLCLLAALFSRGRRP